MYRATASRSKLYKDKMREVSIRGQASRLTFVWSGGIRLAAMELIGEGWERMLFLPTRVNECGSGEYSQTRVWIISGNQADYLVVYTTMCFLSPTGHTYQASRHPIDPLSRDLT